MGTRLPTPDRPETEIDPAVKTLLTRFTTWIKERAFTSVKGYQNA
jgi:hypothetical protein